MNKQICLIILLLAFGICHAQNLVTNGDFEQYSGCPNYYSQIDSAIGWVNPTVGIGLGSTPDYFNVCHNGIWVGVPGNTLGYQYANSGVAYAGIYCSYDTIDPNYREYIETAITTPLNANACYHFEMYVSIANNCKVTTDDIGVYFSDTLITGISSWSVLPFVPQISNPTGFITDSLGWTLISGNYTALGGESFLIIGNFKDSSNTSLLNFNISGGMNRVYLYIDDVSLTPCTGIEEDNNPIIKISPNPFTDKIDISITNNEIVEFAIYDITGMKIMQQSLTYSTSINTQHLAKGMYFYELVNNKGVIKNGKLVKN